MSGRSPTLNEAYFFVGFNFQRPSGGIRVNAELQTRKRFKMFLFQISPQTETAIQIIWWIGIVVALIVTVIDVIFLLRVIAAAKKIERLAERTLPSAVGIMNNTSAIKNLEATNHVAAELLAKATPIVNVANSIDSKLKAVSAFVGGGK
jgi:hypothetical protein